MLPEDTDFVGETENEGVDNPQLIPVSFNLNEDTRRLLVEVCRDMHRNLKGVAAVFAKIQKFMESSE